MKNNPRYPLSTVAKLNITSIFDPRVPSTVEDFKSFFTNKITTFREKATQAKSCDMMCYIRSDVSDKPCVGIHGGPLISFKRIIFSEMSIIQRSKSTMSILDPIPTNLQGCLRNPWSLDLEVKKLGKGLFFMYYLLMRAISWRYQCKWVCNSVLLKSPQPQCCDE